MRSTRRISGLLLVALLALAVVPMVFAAGSSQIATQSVDDVPGRDGLGAVSEPAGSP